MRNTFLKKNSSRNRKISYQKKKPSRDKNLGKNGWRREIGTQNSFTI